jgi:hypothetical protein
MHRQLDGATTIVFDRPFVGAGTAQSFHRLCKELPMTARPGLSLVLCAVILVMGFMALFH